MTVRSLLAKAFTGPGGPTRLAGALLMFGTIASQHPNPAFDKVKRKDPFSAMFPNWRFFAPLPAQHDYHVTYRTLSNENVESPWGLIEIIAGRRLRQISWYPARRAEKALFDIASDLITNLDKGLDVVRTLPTYLMLQEFVRDQACLDNREDVRGFQFALLRHTGYDESGEPEVIFVSPYTPMFSLSLARDNGRTVETGEVTSNS